MDADRPASRARRMAGLALPGRSTFLASRAILFTVRLLQVVYEADRESLVCHAQELALLADLTVGLLPMVIWLAVSRLALPRQIVGLCTEPGCKDWCIGFRAALVALGVVVVVAVVVVIAAAVVVVIIVVVVVVVIVGGLAALKGRWFLSLKGFSCSWRSTHEISAWAGML